MAAKMTKSEIISSMVTTTGLTLARVGETPVIAPHDGIIARLLVIPDARVATGEPLLEIARPETLRVVPSILKRVFRNTVLFTSSLASVIFLTAVSTSV